MKKYLMGLFFLSVLLLAGCSKDNEANEGDDDGGKKVENEFKITPPSWLIGTWGDDYGMVEVKYSKDNVALKYMQMGVELNALQYAKEMKKVCDISQNQGFDCNVKFYDQTKGNDYTVFLIVTQMGVSTDMTMKATRINNNEINFSYNNIDFTVGSLKRK